MRASAAQFDLVQLPLTVFSANVVTKYGVYLNRAPFSSHVDVISSPTSYQASQQLGENMRASGVQAFTYYSARSQEKEVNVALFTPSAFQFKNPNEASFQTWQCTVHHGVVEFTQENVLQRQVVQFSESLFLVNGDLPVPAV